MQRIGRIYTGRVQGVGFRATTHSLAKRLGVDGWVRNEDDGSVRIVALGEPGELDALERGIDEHLGGGIERADAFEPADADLPTPGAGFEIRA